MLVRGLAWSVVDDEDVEELLRRQPDAKVVGVEGAGHSVQGDRPLELAAILSDFLFPRAVMDRAGLVLAPRARAARRDPRRGARLRGAVRLADRPRAWTGNTLSWAYVFEWPLFAAYAVYMWWRLLHEAPDAAPEAVAENGRAAVVPGQPDAQEAQEDAEMAAYNEYLARLADQDRATGR